MIIFLQKTQNSLIIITRENVYFERKEAILKAIKKTHKRKAVKNRKRRNKQIGIAGSVT